REQYQAEDVKKYILSTGDSKSSLLAKCRTSKQLNLYKAVTILDSGVGLSGVIAANGVNMRSFASDPNAGGDSGQTISRFGKALIQNLESRVSPKKN
ncbi:MAG: serine protease/subtilase, partial [Bdellovibrio sp. CG10_big_fil_rev_8_21_14_0_10_47_8]